MMRFIQVVVPLRVGAMSQRLMMQSKASWERSETALWQVGAVALMIFSLGYNVKKDLAEVKSDFRVLKSDVASLKSELKSDVTVVRSEIASLKSELKTDIARVYTNVESLRETIGMMVAVSEKCGKTRLQVLILDN